MSRVQQFSWWDIALILWVFGVCGCAGLGTLRYLCFIRALTAECPAREAWDVEWQSLLKHRHVSAPIRMAVTPELGPALCRLPTGYRLVVPEKLWQELSPPERIAILRHEVAHYESGDLWGALAARALAMLHWFNPLAWWAAAELEAQAEFACDRVAAGGDAPTFAAILIRLGSSGQTRLAGVRSMASGRLFERIERLLRGGAGSGRWRSALVTALAGIALVPAGVRVRVVSATAAEQGPQVKDQAVRIADSAKRAAALAQFGTDDLRTRDFITAMAFSPDGKLIAASPANGEFPRVWLFDVATGRAVKRVRLSEEPRGSVTCLAFSPDQSRLIWGEMSGQVAIWDIERDRLVYRSQRHQGSVNDVAVSPDGQLLASAGADGALHLCPVKIPDKIVSTFGKTARPSGGAPMAGMAMSSSAGGGGMIAFTPDGARLVAGTAAGGIEIWRIADGKLLRRIPRAHGTGQGPMNPSLNCIAITPDGRRLMSSGQHTVPIGETKLEHGPKNVTMTEIRVWDIETGERLKDFQGDEDHGFGLAALSRDGKHIAIGDFAVLRIIDATTGSLEQTISLPGSWGRRPAFSPDGETVAMPIGNEVAIFETRTGRRLHHDEQTCSGAVRSAAWSPSGERLVTGHGDGYVRVWEAGTGKLLWQRLLAPVISRSGWNAVPSFVTFSADSRRVVVAGRRDDPIEWKNGIVAVFEAQMGLLVREAFQQEIRQAALSPDRKLLVVGTSHGGANDTHLIGIEVETGRTVYTSPPPEEPAGFWMIRSMQFQPGSATLVAATGDGTVVVLDGLTGKTQRRFVAEYRTPDELKTDRFKEPQMWEATVSVDGQTVVASSAQFIHVWDVATGKMRKRIRHPHEHGCHLRLSPDGRTLATSDLLYAGDYGVDTIRLIDLESGEQIMTADPDDNRAGVLCFSPDGKQLFTGYDRGSATIWDVSQ